MRGGHLISAKKDSHECQSVRPSVKGAPHSQKEAKVSSPPSAEASKGRKFALGGGCAVSSLRLCKLGEMGNGGSELECQGGEFCS